jgi:predicted Fe-Mo cluster-binding NifX family protein
MKIIFTTSGWGEEAPLDPRFGRAAGFLLYDSDDRSFQPIDNIEGADSGLGAGIQAAERVAKAGADVVVTGHCGPKAFRVLHAAGVKVFNTEAATVADALDLFRAGRLVEATEPDVDGHWS